MRTATTRTITGRVNSNGTIVTGDGFSVNKTGTGTYVVTVSPNLRLLSATASWMNNQAGVGTDTWGSNTFRVVTWNVAGSALIDNAFSFTATVAA